MRHGNDAENSAGALSAVELHEMYRTARQGVLAHGLWSITFVDEKEGKLYFGGLQFRPAIFRWRRDFL